MVSLFHFFHGIILFFRFGGKCCLRPNDRNCHSQIRCECDVRKGLFEVHPTQPQNQSFKSRLKRFKLSWWIDFFDEIIKCRLHEPTCVNLNDQRKHYLCFQKFPYTMVKTFYKGHQCQQQLHQQIKFSNCVLSSWRLK